MKQVTISNAYLTLMVLDYGATIQKLLVKGENDEYTNVVVGYNHPSRYRLDDNVLGASVGRYAGRISEGGFTLDRERYLQIIYEGMTDRSTVINLTNHSYFKLDKSPYIDEYELQLNCPYRLETKENLLPTGDIIPVRKTGFDFLLPRKIGVQRLDAIFIKDIGNEKVAELHSKSSGITMKVYTNQPALVVYTPSDFPGICFEAQNYPDAPNQPDFPKSVLRPGDIYNNISIFKFDLDSSN